MIVLTKTFRKSLSAFETRVEGELMSLISKYHRGLSISMFQIMEHNDYVILK